MGVLLRLRSSGGGVGLSPLVLMNSAVMHLSSASPRGGQADVGEYGDLIENLQQIFALVVGDALT